MNDLRLTIEPMPESSSRTNLRERIKPSRWDQLRKQVYADNGHKCAVCGAEGVMLNCHEIWDYDDEKHIQRLAGFTALCNMCHAVKHVCRVGLAEAILGLASRGQFDPDEPAAAHFMKVNQCDRATWDKHYDESRAVRDERSKYRWRVHLGEYAHYVTDSPRLRRIPHHVQSCFAIRRITLLKMTDGERQAWLQKIIKTAKEDQKHLERYYPRSVAAKALYTGQASRTIGEESAEDGKVC